MGTKRCPYCSGEIKSVAKKCKHCGKWLEIETEAAPKIQEKRKDNAEDDDDSKLKIFLVVLIALIIGVAGLLTIHELKFNTDQDADTANKFATDSICTVDEYSKYNQTTDNSSDGNTSETYTIEYSDVNNNTDDNSPTTNIERYKQSLQGIYLMVEPLGGGFCMDCGAYKIDGDRISYYTKDANRDTWDKEFTAIYTIKYMPDNYYMTGYNLIFNDPRYGERRICTGDTNDDGIMDLWMSDSNYYSKARDL